MKNPNEYRFLNEHGSLFFYCGDKLIYGFKAGEHLAFAFDFNEEIPSHSILLKHGPVSRIEEWVNHAIKEFRALGNETADDMAKSIMMISAPTEGPGAWDIEEINRFISHSGYIGIWYDANKLQAQSGLEL